MNVIQSGTGVSGDVAITAWGAATIYLRASVGDAVVTIGSNSFTLYQDDPYVVLPITADGFTVDSGTVSYIAVG